MMMTIAPTKATKTTKTAKRRTGRAARFPGKLHDLMNFVEETGLEYVISWELNGWGIKIHHPKLLVEEILPLFFEQTKYRSFRRQLNMWHFERIAEGPHKGIFLHPFFVRHERDLSTFMSRNNEMKPFLLD